MESVKSTAPNYQDLSTSIQLVMLLLKEIEELEVYVGAIHSHREEPPHVELSNTFFDVLQQILSSSMSQKL